MSDFLGKIQMGLQKVDFQIHIASHSFGAEGCVSGLRAAARKPDTQPSTPHHTDNLKTKAPNTTGSNHLYNTLDLLMMGIIVPETCWASSKICNKNHLLHLVGILFPHIRHLLFSSAHYDQLRHSIYPAKTFCVYLVGPQAITVRTCWTVRWSGIVTKVLCPLCGGRV